jgi:hypothetical protein
VQATGDVPIAANYSKIAAWGTQMVPLTPMYFLLNTQFSSIFPSSAFRHQVALNDVNARAGSDPKIHLLDTGTPHGSQSCGFVPCPVVSSEL